MSSRSDHRAVIVGAGIGGLAAAIALRRAGWDVQVIEQAVAPRELGFALALAPNAIAALRELGVADQVIAQGVEVKTFEMRRADGRVLKRLDFEAGRVQSLMVLRPALHGTLLATVGAEALQLGRRVAASPPHAVVGSGFSVLGFSTEDPDLTPTGTAEVAGEVVVGADGVGSVVRRWLHPEEPAPRPSGYRALRGVTHDAGAALGNCDAAVYFGDAVEIGLTRASATAVYWYISLLDEGEDLDAAASIDRCGRGLDARALDIMRAARPDDMRVDRLFVRDPLTRWGSGRVTLLGDAAHPVLPHTAQGAALALEDAVALGLALGATGSDVEPSLRRYERVRAARTRPVVTSGPRLAAMTTTRSRASRVLRDALIRAIPARALTSALARHARDPHRELR